jgi:hypothetical protein
VALEDCMNELKDTVIHHIEQAAKKAGVRFDIDCYVELVAVFDAAEQRITQLEARLTALEESVSVVENDVEALSEYQANWRNRR